MPEALVDTDSTRVLYPELDRRYPVIVRGEGAWAEDSAGNRYLDSMSGGSMALTLGHGRRDIIEVARRQAEQLAYVHNERLTNPPQERLAAQLVEVAPEGLTRVQFVTGGAEANETALRLARSYHVERGDDRRWQVISPAQAYHGPTVATLALTGRPGLWGPYGPYLAEHLHIPPATRRLDPSGEAALEALDARLEQAGPENVSVFFCEGISAAALPSYTPPEAYWRGLDERRREHGFLIAFDEVVTGMGRAGNWFAALDLPVTPDIIATAKGLGAGYVPIGATLCAQHLYEAFEAGSRSFPLGHTWNGAPLPCAVGSKVVEVLQSEGLVDHVRQRGPRMLEELRDAIGEIPIVGEIRGHGYLLGVDYVDPRDGESILPPDLGVAGRVDAAALARELITLSTQPTGDGYAGDQSLFAPPFVSSEEELAEMVERFAASVQEVSEHVEPELAGREPEPDAVPAGDRQ